MFYLAIVIAIIFFIGLLIQYPGFRVAVVSIVALLGVAIFIMLEREDAEREARKNRISLDQVVIENPRSDGGYSKNFNARVFNKAPSAILTGVEFKIQFFDCPSYSTPIEDCPIIGEQTANQNMNVPPGQARDISFMLYWPNTVKGVIKWSYQVLGTVGINP